MPKIDIANLKLDNATGYPEPFRRDVMGRWRKRLGNAVGLDQFGVNLTTLKAGAWSSQRHWHANEDELKTRAKPYSSPATPPAGKPTHATAIV